MQVASLQGTDLPSCGDPARMLLGVFSAQPFSGQAGVNFSPRKRLGDRGASPVPTVSRGRILSWVGFPVVLNLHVLPLRNVVPFTRAKSSLEFSTPALVHRRGEIPCPSLRKHGSAVRHRAAGFPTGSRFLWQWEHGARSRQGCCFLRNMCAFLLWFLTAESISQAIDREFGAW